MVFFFFILYKLEESFFWTGDQLFDLIWALLFVLLFLFRLRWKNPYNVSHVLNRWSMTLFLPICDRFTGRAKHYAPGRKKMLKPQSSFSIFPRQENFHFLFHGREKISKRWSSYLLKKSFLLWRLFLSTLSLFTKQNTALQLEKEKRVKSEGGIFAEIRVILHKCYKRCHKGWGSFIQSAA